MRNFGHRNRSLYLLAYFLTYMIHVHRTINSLLMGDAMHSGVAPIYDLFAVLIHLGKTASSGHYTAVIKDPVAGVTYKFNDTEVEKDKKFTLSNEEESGTLTLRFRCIFRDCPHRAQIQGWSWSGLEFLNTQKILEYCLEKFGI